MREASVSACTKKGIEDNATPVGVEEIQGKYFMGLKNWLAKNVAGVSTYGRVMGKECVTNGIVLGRVLYLGHGIRPTSCTRFVFEDEKAMQLDGFKLYCEDPLNRPAMEDSSELSKQTRAVGIAFAVQLCLAAASNFMRKEANRSDFQRSLGAGTGASLAALNSGIEIDNVTHFLNIPSGEVSQVLDLKNPGTGDMLGAYLQELNRKTPNGSIGFQRGTVLGFDVAAVPLAQETVLKIREASQNFNW